MARSSELEQAILSAPDNRDTYRVYADWLIDQGDARGELIARSLAYEQTWDVKLGAMIDGYIARKADELLGELAALPAHAVTWRLGFFDRLALDASTLGTRSLAAVLELALAHPGALLLRRLQLSARSGRAIDDALAVIGRESAIVVSRGSSAVAPPSGAPRLPRTRSIVELELVTDTPLGTLDALAPPLRSLAIAIPRSTPTRRPISREAMASIARGRWPLHTLKLELGAEPWFDELAALLARTDLALTTLHLQADGATGFATEVTRALLASPLVPQLEHVRLDIGLGVPEYRLLQANRPRFAKLRKLEPTSAAFRKGPR